MELADRIRAARTERGWGQRKLAEKLRVSASAVAQWETGTTKPSIMNRGKLASELGLSLSELLPEAIDIGPLTISDPATVLVVERLLALPEPIREAFLLQVDAIFESLGGPARDVELTKTPVPTSEKKRP